MPRCELECFFDISLIPDNQLDLEYIKKNLPAIFWQLVQQQPGNDFQLLPNIQLTQQRLWLDESIFSQLLLIQKNTSLQILYIQLLPPIQVLANIGNTNYLDHFTKKYYLCFKRTLRNIKQNAKHNGITEISVTLLNPDLVGLFKQAGFIPVQETGHSTITHVCQEFNLVLKLPKPQDEIVL